MPDNGEGRAVNKFDSTGAARALEIMGKHIDVGAFKARHEEGKQIDQNGRDKIIHITKEEYERQCIEHAR
jgi:hypothetical protein